ncbi:hypothetical protein BDR04DRAFT_1133197 [Suillus decipiens]|nr:hypothetical protein BDR04DRAFT_1133197 [Suillus decipiens]
MPLGLSSQQLDNTVTRQCTCVCKKNFGIVFLAIWYRHLQQAETDEEKEQIRAGKILHDTSGSAISRASEPPSIRRAAVLCGLAQRVQEDQTSIWRTGRRKRARMSKTEPPDLEQALEFESDIDMHLDNDMDLPNNGAHKNDFSGPDNNFPDNDNDLIPPCLPTPEPCPPTPEPRLPTPEPCPPTPEPCLPTPEPCLPTPEPCLPTPEPRLPTLEPCPPTPDAHVLQQQPEHGIKFECRQPLNINIEALAQLAVLLKIQETFEFILALKNASLEDPVAKMNDEALERLRNPPKVPLEINNPGIRHSISMYLALEHGSQDAYNRVRRSTMRNFAGAAAVDDIPSFYHVEKLISTHTGVKSLEHDMCSQSCLAFMGPYSALDCCLICDTSHWNQARLQVSNGCTRVTAQKFITIPLGLQLQAFAHDMRYLCEWTQQILAQLRATQTIPVIDDIAMGQDILGVVLDGDIKPNDIVLMVSLDGAQLCGGKQSNCWMYIWIIVNLSPNKHYRKIHPKNVDSFLFIGMHHLAAIQNEGLTIWDASCDVTFISDIHLLFTTADGPWTISN